MWRWESTNPGITIIPEASIVSTWPLARPGPTARMVSPSIITSPEVKSPSAGSRLRTVPPWIRVLPDGITPKSVPAG